MNSPLTLRRFFNVWDQLEVGLRLQVLERKVLQVALIRPMPSRLAIGA